jgi:hypothetical protein
MKEQPWPIPAHLIKKEKVDLENEALSALGASVAVGSTLISQPLCLGVMSMLEIMDNALIKMLFTGDVELDPQSHDLHTVFYLNHHRKDALEDVREWFRGKPYSENNSSLDKKISAFAKQFKLKDTDLTYVQEMLHRSSLGFKMIPGKGGSEMIYGAETIAGMSYQCSQKLNISADAVIWETPLTLIGHIVALSAIENGTKNVERPHDLEHLNWFKETCAQCDADESMAKREPV